MGNSNRKDSRPRLKIMTLDWSPRIPVSGMENEGFTGPNFKDSGRDTSGVEGPDRTNGNGTQ